MSLRRTLLIIPSLTAERIPPSDPRLSAAMSAGMTIGFSEGGGVGLTRKFHEGILEYVRLWNEEPIIGRDRFNRNSSPGLNDNSSGGHNASDHPQVIVSVDPREDHDENMDPIALTPANLPYTLRWSPSSESELESLLSSVSVVLASLVDRHVHLAALCRRLGVPLIFITEYSLNTRKQIIRTQTRNKLLQVRRSLWSARQERRNIAAIRLAAGVQCNGTPTFNAYAPLNNNCLLYFDTRVTSDMLISSSALDVRLSHLSANKPLRLAFSGRLNHMKGADHLPLIAAEIRRLSIPFTLDVCGAGLLESSMRAKVAELNLQNEVRFKGVLDFKSQLMPFIASEIDLFLCPHRQGDPSCTYLETLSCGVPIVGYDNEAFTGICSMADIGWTSTMDSPIKIAHVIARLHRDRSAIAAAARNALAFAARHTFENTMSKRINHLYHCMHMSAPLLAK